MSSFAPQARLAAFSCACSIGLVACASPEAARLDGESVVASLQGRGDPEVLRSVLDGLELSPSFMSMPAESERVSPSQPGYWFVRALAWSPEVRAARRELAAARALAKSAGAPRPIAVQAVDHELGGDDDLVEAIGVFDLIGLFGIGPSRAERERASAEAWLAAGRLERIAFEAWIEVERARISVVAARRRWERLGELHEAAQLDLRRVQILEEAGRLGAADAALARAEVARIERRQLIAEATLEAARTALARSSGAVPEEGRFGADVEAVGDAGLAEIAGPEALRPWPVLFIEQQHELLVESHPALREAQLLFAVREAEVREVAASAWPGVALGPHLGYLNHAQLGAVLRLAIPFPSSWKGRLEAAEERRDRAIEAFEESLLALSGRLVEAHTRLASYQAAAEGDTGPTRRATDPAIDHWDAARARFRAGRGSLSGWTQALNHLNETLNWPIDDVEAIALARLDISALKGPVATPFAPLYFDDDGGGEVEVAP